MKKSYVLIYSDTAGSRDTIKSWATEEAKILHWRYDMPHCFYLVSESDASELSDSLIEFNGRKGRFLIMEASPNRQGLLPQESWYVLRNNSRMPKSD